MKIFFTIFLYVALHSVCIGQNIEYHKFTGSITTSDGQVISLKLEVNEIVNGEFKGFSITNYEGKDYTKSVVEGKLNLKTKKMSFREISNTETKSSADASTFCYISAPDLTIETSGKKNIIKGKFEGLFPSGKPCATGVIVLVNEDNLENIVNAKEVKQPDSMLIKSATNPTIPDSVFRSNEVLSINDWKNGLTIEFWDGDVEDNDEIAIYLNDKLKRDKLVLRHKKTIIALPSDENTFQLKIVALNEGRSGLNTLNFKLRNASTEKEYISVLRKGESFIIDFKRD